MIRKAIIEDLKDILKIIKQTIAEMSTYNNTQWDENYPKEEHFMSDIQNGDLFVIEREGELVGFVCINEIEPTEYNSLNWTLNERAMVVHRMAVNSEYRRCGIGSEFMKFVDEFALKNNIRYLKTDTYSLNTKMNALFKKYDYNFIGEMSFLGKEEQFYCYEKILNKEE